MTDPTTLKMRMVATADLTEDPRNARIHGDRNLAAIRDSLERFGQRKPLVVRADGTVVAGNGTLRAARALGWAKVAVTYLPDDTDATAYAIADNRSAELAEWNTEILDAALSELDAAGFTPDELGFTTKERRLLAERMTVDVAEDHVGARPAKPTTRTGDLWQLGPHRLVCGDSRDPATVARVLAGDPIDFLFTSPPYNVGKDYAAWDDVGDWPTYRALLDDVLTAWLPHLPAGRAVAWNIGTSRRTYPGRHYALLEEHGLDYYRQMVWHKVGVPIPTFAATRANPVARQLTSNFTHELVLVFSRGDLEEGGPLVRRFEPEYAHRLVLLFAKAPLERGGAVRFGDALENDVFTIAQAQAGRETPADPTASKGGGSQNLDTRKAKAHPAPFPVALPASFLVHLADVGKVVADPFLGAGTTIIAAAQLDRVGVGVELDRGYCDLVVERWQDMTGGKAVRATRNRTA